MYGIGLYQRSRDEDGIEIEEFLMDMGTDSEFEEDLKEIVDRLNASIDILGGGRPDQYFRIYEK